MFVPHWWCPQHHGFWPHDPGEQGIAVPQSSTLAESWPMRKGWLVTRLQVHPAGPQSGIGLQGNLPMQAPEGSTSRWKIKNKALFIHYFLIVSFIRDGGEKSDLRVRWNNVVTNNKIKAVWTNCEWTFSPHYLDWSHWTALDLDQTNNSRRCWTSCCFFMSQLLWLIMLISNIICSFISRFLFLILPILRHLQYVNKS